MEGEENYRKSHQFNKKDKISSQWEIQIKQDH